MLTRLKQLRQEQNVSQKKLALALGITQQSVNQYENQKIEPDIATLCAIADYFDTSVDFLIGHTDVQRVIEPVTEFMLNETEATLIRRYRRMDSKARTCMELLSETLEERKP